MLEDVRQRAREMLSAGEAAVVVGYRAARRGGLPTPYFARTPEDAERLIIDPRCAGGLAVYARREAASAPACFVVCRHDIRALQVLAQEKQVEPERILVIGYECDIPGSPLGKVWMLEGRRLADFAAPHGETRNATVDEELARLKAMKPAQRARYWREQFDRCVRCYACRAACPMCYCAECIADRNLPQWIETVARPRGNFSWNLIRAWHLAGRCVGCGTCARACPEGIRLDLLNLLLADEVKAAFGYVPGEGAAEEAGVFASFKESDDESFILEK